MVVSRSVAILGGGISGLTTAHYLLSNAAKHSVSISKCYILERQSRFGGWLHSRSFGPNADDIFELGPRTISTNSYAGTNVIALVFRAFKNIFCKNQPVSFYRPETSV